MGLGDFAQRGTQKVDTLRKGLYTIAGCEKPDGRLSLGVALTGMDEAYGSKLEAARRSGLPASGVGCARSARASGAGALACLLPAALRFRAA